MHISRQLLSLVALSLFSQLGQHGKLHADLISGPMLAKVDMREAKIWAQADRASSLSIRYQASSGGPTFESPSVPTSASLSNTAVLTLDAIEPGLNYTYQVLQDGQPVGPKAEFTSPENYFDRSPPPAFRFAAGGAHYAIEDDFEPPYQLLGGGYGIFQSILNSKPAFMLWAGNTSHLRLPDYTSQSGTLKRYTHARSVPELTPLLSNIPNYAVWGNADYSPIATDRQYAYRKQVETCFNAFWPRPIAIPSLEGVCSQFSYADADFFLLDVHSYRNHTSGLPTVLGEEQLAWLRTALKNSTATFKFILSGAPVLNPAKNPSNLSFAEREHTRLLDLIRADKTSGLFFISGGKAYGEMTKLVHASGYNLFDLTLGPMTANPVNSSNELNYFRVPATTTYERQFALFEISGPEEDRLLTIHLKSMEGDDIWTREIRANDLRNIEK